jgi:putative endonuclease
MALEAPWSQERSSMDFKVYILWSESLQKFYVGSTNNLKDRLYRHNSGQGDFTVKGIPWKLIWSIDCVDRKEALQLENKIKKRGIKRYLLDHNIEFGK